MTDQQWNFTEGTDVVGSDGGKVGEVVAVHQNYIVVEKGFFFPTDYYIPTSAVANYDGDRIYLNVTKDAALDQGWDTAPADDAYVTTGTEATAVGTGFAADTGMDTDASYSGTFEHHTQGVEHEHAGTAAGSYASAAETTSVQDEGTVRVPVHEEELTATTREREIGQVRIEKDVVAEERTLEVPVTEERVRVERRVVDRTGDVAADAFQEGVIEVPVRGEEVEVQKRARVAEEVEIAKEAVQRTERVADTVRREEVYVTEDVDQTAGTVRSSDTTYADTTTGTTGTGGATGGGSGEGILDRVRDAITPDDEAGRQGSGSTR